MTTNPNSLAFDAENEKLICEECVEWTDFTDLYIDENGDRWDTCRWCGSHEARPLEIARVV